MGKGKFGLYNLIKKTFKNKPRGRNRLFAVFFLLIAISLFNSDLQRLLGGGGSIAKAATNLPTPTLVGPAHDVWINSNPTFSATVSSLGGDVGEYNSIAVGTDGNPVISYFDRTNTALKVAKCSNAACTGVSTITTIDNNAQPFDTSIAIGREVPNGLPVISYQGGVNNTIMVAKCSNAACTASTTNQIDLVASTSAGRWNDITVGTDGFPVISYTEWSQAPLTSPHKLKVAKCSSASCSGAKTITQVDSQTTISFTYTSIALGTEATGLPIIIYHEDLNGQLRIAKCIQAACTSFTKTTLTPGGQAGRFNDIAVGSGNLPVMSYNIQNGATESLNAIKCTVANCTASGNAVVHSAVSNQFGHDTGITIGTDTFPVISYDHLNNADLWVAKCINVSCTGVSTKTAVDMGGAVGSYNDVALGREATGLPVISYYDATNKDLKVAKCANAACTGASTITMVDAGSGSNNVRAVFHWVAVDPISTPPDTNGLWVVGSGNSTHTWAPALADGIYDWQAKALDANGDDSNFSGLWRVKKDTLNPTAVCGSLSYSDPNISLQLTPFDGVPASGGTPSGLASGDLQISDNGVWGPSQNLISGTYTQAATIGHTYSARYRVTDNAGNVSDSGSYTDCGIPVTATAPGWIQTSGGDVGSIADINFSTAQVKADYLVLGDALVTNFASARNWLVQNYSSIGGIQSGFTNAIFSELWQNYGKGKATDWPSPGPPDNNGIIPSAKGVYAYPSVAAINSGNSGPPDEADFTFTNAAGSIPADTSQVVLFINGNLNINADLNLAGKKVIFIVKKDVIVKAQSPLVNLVDGVFVAEGEFKSGVNDIDLQGDAGEATDFTSIAIGSDDLPVISYYDTVSGSLKITHCGNVGCTSGNTTSTIDSFSGGGFNASGYNSLTIGSDDLPVIAYVVGSIPSFTLRLAKCSDVACTSSTNTLIGNMGSSGNQPSVAIGRPTGFPVIAYTEVGTATKGLKVTSCGNTACTLGNSTSTVDTQGYSYASIAIGTDDLPIISYRETFDSGGSLSEDLKVAHCGNSTCTAGNTIRYVDSTGNTGFFTAIIIGSDGLPAISYYNRSNDNIRLAHCNDTACTTSTRTTIDSAQEVGFTTDIAIGTNGFPVVSAYDLTNENLRIVYCGGVTCPSNSAFSFTLDAPGSVGYSNSIAVGSDGFPIVSYIDTTNGVLKVAKEVTPGAGAGCSNPFIDYWTCITVDGESGGGGDCPTCQLVLNGWVTAFGGFDLGRDLGASNSTTPAEVFNYDPSYLYLFSQVDPSSGRSLLGEVRTLFLQLPP